MKLRPDRPVAGQPDNLLFCRMATLGLDLDAIARGDSKTFAELEQRCLVCEARNACTGDLERDPNNPVWETYCPNQALLNTLTADLWVPQ